MDRSIPHQIPGQLISALLSERGWTQEVLAVVLGMSKSAVSLIVAGKRDVDAALALKLGTAFGTEPEDFMELQKRYDLARARILLPAPDPAMARRADLFGKLPVNDMIKRGWIAATDIRDLRVESELARFFGVESPDDIEVLPFAAKRTDVFGEPVPAQLAWFHRVRSIAQEMIAPRYSEATLRAALPKLRSLMTAPENAADVTPILMQCGVRFLIVETIGNAKIDGVCFWLQDGIAPVIAISTRFDRIDNFWFVLRHEIDHVLRGHGRGKIMLDSSPGADEPLASAVADEERIANESAADFCVPQTKLRKFIAVKAPLFSERDILGLARVVRVHPGIVVGQLRHATGRNELFAKHLAKIRFAVVAKATVDGWGEIVPVGQ
jgi:HTH-type transcriptional regulator / antitoxin HigA